MLRSFWTYALWFGGALAVSTTAPPSPTQSGLISTCTQYYDPVSGDTCDGIVSRYDNAFTLSQFYAWNPAVGSSCTNLEIGYYVCVGVSTAASTTSKTSTTSKVSTPSPVESGTVSNCNNFYDVQSGDTCQGIVNKYGTFTLAQFDSWNPAINAGCTNLQIGYYVCVGVSGSSTTTSKTTSTSSTSKSSTKSTTSSSKTTTTSAIPSPTPTGIISSCNKYYQVVTGDTCASIASAFGTFTVAQFEGWNKAINSGCTNLIAGDYYCVGVASTSTSSIKPTITSSLKTTSTKSTTTASDQPQQSGIVSNCDAYYLVKSGDTCSSIDQTYSITLSQFLAWNTGINSQCTNLLAGYYCCVGIS